MCTYESDNTASIANALRDPARGAWHFSYQAFQQRSIIIRIRVTVDDINITKPLGHRAATFALKWSLTLELTCGTNPVVLDY